MGDAGGQGAGGQGATGGEGGHIQDAGAVQTDAGFGGQTPDAGAEMVKGPVCGDGIEADEEVCDLGGETSQCSSRCELTACPDGCRCESFDGGAYAFCDAARLWTDAAAECQKFGGQLAALETDAENRFVLSRSRGTNWLLGGSDSALEGKWVWPDGVQFWSGGAQGALVSPLVAHWAGGEPNDSGNGIENCLQFVADGDSGRWNDWTCATPAPYICERRVAPAASCGNGAVNVGEACDGPGSTAECDADCTAPFCGDGVLNTAANEDCDDGNSDDFDTCSSKCSAVPLVAQWPLNERGGSRFRDLVSGYDLSPVGFSIGASEVSLSGTDQYLRSVSGGNPAELNFAEDFTISVRAKFSVAMSGFRPIVVHGQESGAHLYIAVDGANIRAGFRAGKDSIVAERAAALPLDSEWHHLVLRFAAGTWSLWVDGEEAGTQENAGFPTAIGAGWAVGGFADGNGSKFRGSVRSVRLFSQHLSDDQVKALRKQGD